MKKAAMVTLFSCFMLVLTLVFGNTHSAFAGHGVTAQQASAGDMDDMKNFLLHMKEHLEQIRNDDEHAEFRNALRTDDGVWKSGTTYIIFVNRKLSGPQTFEAGEIIDFHAGHPAAQGGSLRHIPIFEQLMTEVLGANGGAACVQDSSGKYGNHVCAVETTTTTQSGAQKTIYSVAGFDHEESDVSFDKVQCPDLGPEYFGKSATRLLPNGEEEEFTRTSADMVDDEGSLKNYLKTVDEHITNEIKKFRANLPEFDRLTEAQQRGVAISRLAGLKPCWRDENEPWKSGEIYFYLIRYTDKQYGIFNGLDPRFEDVTLRLYDGCIDVGQTVFQKLEEKPDGFLEYYWSNPVKPDDRVVDASGNPIRGLSPGTSVKLGYFLTTNFGGTIKVDFVLGSGIYTGEEYYIPENRMCQDIPDDLSELARDHLDEFPVFPEQEEDDGGCALASGNQGNLKVVGFNLLLITLVTFFAVSRKSRLSREFWTWKL